MNYFALAGGIIAGLLALAWTGNILKVTFGNARWGSGWSLAYHVVCAGVTATLAVWLFSMVPA